jgi:hypothetical protein
MATIGQQHPDWAAEMKRSDLSFEEICDLNKLLWPVAPDQPGQGYKQFQRWKWLWENRLQDDGTLPSGSDVIRIWQELNSYTASRSMEGNWYPQGPILDELTSRENIDGVGRTSALAFHPANPSILLAGTPAGGLWRSEDGGLNWTTNTDWFPTLGVSSIIFDPVDPSIVYAGTGDRDAADALGMGVIKSTDGGINWDFSNVGIEDLSVGALRILPGSGVIIAGTNDGIFRSADNGVSWEYVSSNSVDYRDIEVHPTNPNIVYATGAGKFFRSLDGGLEWDWVQEGINSGTRMVIAVTPAAPDRVYVLSSTTFEFKAMYMSDNSGETFTEMSEEPNILGWSADGSSDGGQAWYDLGMEADHEDPNVVYVGGIRLKKSIDQGVTWSDINPNYVHVDQHELIVSPHDQDLYVCNDGGIYHYVANDEWKDISTGLVNGQIYRIGQSVHNPYKVLNGFQDNGTSEFNGASWQRRGGGDGFECLYDHTDENWRYGSIYYGQIYRTNENVINEKICGQDELDITESGAWSTPYFLAPWDENILFVGLKNVWRCNNIKTPNRDDIVWTKVSANLGGNDLTDLNNIETCKSNIDIMYASEGNRKLFRSNNINSETPTWITLSNSLPVFNTPVLAIETHPTDSNIVYISYRQDVYKSVDMGDSWLNMTETFPDITINSIVYDTAGVEEALYIGTDMGIYYKDATMSEWIPYNNGFPTSARVTELEIYYAADHSQSRLKASTYGRGLWESDLYGSSTTLFPAIALLSSDEPSQEVFGSFDLELSFYKNLSSVEVTGLEIEDIYIENATVENLSGGPENFNLSITPTDFGFIKIHVGDSVVTDEDELPNFHSDTLLFVFSPVPDPFGPFGPGGVGDETSLSFWLKADENTFDNGNIPVSENGQQVEQWRDVVNNEYVAMQTTDSRKPELWTAENGINGNPALKFDGDNDWLSLEQVVPGRSISGYMMVEGDSIEWNDHGWFASSREPNGYLMHPWKSSSQYSVEMYDLDDNSSGSPIYYIGDASAPHIYGFIYQQEDLFQAFQTIFDDKVYDFNGIDVGLRDNTTPIDIRIGWDYEQRYGAGKIAEHFIYNRKLYNTHHILVANYMSAKYAVDLGLLSRYHHPNQHLNVFGIGRTTEYDYHTDAQGRGIIRFSNPSDLDNEEYLLCGHDNLGLNFVAGGYPISSERTERTWGYTRTGDPGSVLVRVLASELENTTGLGLIVVDTDEFQPGQSPDYYPLVLDGEYLVSTVSFPEHGVFTIGVEPTVSIEDLNFASAVFFPNPTEETVNIQLNQVWPDFWDLVLYDNLGRSVKTQRFSGKNGSISISDLAPGMYVAEIKVNGTVIEKTKLIRK